jgi:hypothetical protein
MPKNVLTEDVHELSGFSEVKANHELKKMRNLKPKKRRAGNEDKEKSRERR